MKLSKTTYRAMNKAYNTIFDSWQEIEDMPPALFKQLNMSLVLLDQVLDELKKAATEDDPAQESADAFKNPDGTPKFKIFGGKNSK